MKTSKRIKKVKKTKFKYRFILNENDEVIDKKVKKSCQTFYSL